MDSATEKKIFDTATEKLDVYAPSCIEHNRADLAAEFLEPGGQYVCFAVKEFIKELLGHLIKPVGKWEKCNKFIDMQPIFETVKSLMPEHYDVEWELQGYIFSEYVSVTISEILSLRLRRASYHYPTVGIRVDGYYDDRDEDWMGDVAEVLDDEYLRLAANGNVEDCSTCFFPDQTNEFCQVAEYIYANYPRYKEMAENKAKDWMEKLGLNA